MSQNPPCQRAKRKAVQKAAVTIMRSTQIMPIWLVFLVRSAPTRFRQSPETPPDTRARLSLGLTGKSALVEKPLLLFRHGAPENLIAVRESPEPPDDVAVPLGMRQAGLRVRRQCMTADLCSNGADVHSCFRGGPYQALSPPIRPKTS
jgi:hypothetical protein